MIKYNPLIKDQNLFFIIKTFTGFLHEEISINDNSINLLKLKRATVDYYINLNYPTITCHKGIERNRILI